VQDSYVEGNVTAIEWLSAVLIRLIGSLQADIIAIDQEPAMIEFVFIDKTPTLDKTIETFIRENRFNPRLTCGQVVSEINLSTRTAEEKVMLLDEIKSFQQKWKQYEQAVEDNRKRFEWYQQKRVLRLERLKQKGEIVEHLNTMYTSLGNDLRRRYFVPEHHKNLAREEEIGTKRSTGVALPSGSAFLQPFDKRGDGNSLLIASRPSGAYCEVPGPTVHTQELVQMPENITF